MSQTWTQSKSRISIPSYDEKCFLIDGEQAFIHSAAIHYFRFPREEWREVLWKAKLAGITCIDTYFAWNVHEPDEGEWQFTGDQDCEAFLALCAEMGMQVIARPGPYICAEWDFGGFPWWLTKQREMSYRAYDEQFLRYVDRYFDQLIPIIARHQISQGGSVILVQVENEYQHLASDEDGKEYMEYLRDGLISRGIEVPLISCEGGVDGAVECANFWSGADQAYAKLRKKQPHTPKIVTEFWTGWFEKWGGPRADRKTPALLERRIMEVLQAGYTGINHYMFCGGTNFGDFGGRTVDGSDVFMVTSYDYDAPLSEYLKTTPKYHVVKKLGYFIQAVQEFLLGADEVDVKVQMNREGRVRKRKHGDAAIYFVEHEGSERELVSFTTEEGESFQVTVNAGQIAPVISRLPILPGWELTVNAFLGGYQDVEGVPTLLVFADEGQRSSLELTAAAPLDVQPPPSVLQENDAANNDSVLLDLCHFETPQMIMLQSGEQQLRLVVLSSQAMDRVWWVSDEHGASLIIGADGIVEQDGSLHPEVKTLYGSKLVWFGRRELFGEMEVEQGAFGGYLCHMPGCPPMPQPPKLASLEMQELNESNMSPAVQSSTPLSFTQMDRGFGHLQYTTEIYSTERRLASIVLPHTQDPVRVLVNGVSRGMYRETFGTVLSIPLDIGHNRVDLLVQHMGRFNFSYYLGEEKGIIGSAYLDGEREDLRAGWQDEEGRMVHLDQVVSPERGHRLKRSFRLSKGERCLIVGEIGEELWLNGRRIDLGAHRIWYKICAVDLTPYLDEGSESGEQVVEMVGYRAPLARLELLKWKQERAITTWQVRAMDLPLEDGWTAVASNERMAGRPVWYRCSFTAPELPKNMHAKLKLRLTGLSKGSLWLNGYNLGRYWQIGPQEDYKVPIAWLKQENQLLVFDETGCSPRDVELLWEDASFII